MAILYVARKYLWKIGVEGQRLFDRQKQTLFSIRNGGETRAIQLKILAEKSNQVWKLWPSYLPAEDSTKRDGFSNQGHQAVSVVS